MAFASDGIEMPAATPSEYVARSGPRPDLDHFLSVSVAVLDALRPPLDQLVLVLAPTVVDSAEQFDADLTGLLTRAEFASCRVILVLDIDVPPPAFTLQTLGAAALVCECLTDPAQKQRDLQALVGLDGTAPIAGVWPLGVVPPRRIDAKPEQSAAVVEAIGAALHEAGITPAYLEHAPVLRRLILGAALRDGRGPDGGGCAYSG